MFWPLQSLSEGLGVHRDSNSQSGSSLGSVSLHPHTFSHSSWPAPLQAFALVTSPRLGSWHRDVITCSATGCPWVRKHYNSAFFFFFFFLNSFKAPPVSLRVHDRKKEKKKTLKLDLFQDTSLPHLVSFFLNSSVPSSVGWQRCNNISSLQQH